MNMWTLTTPDEMVLELPAMISVGLGKAVCIGSTDGQVKPASSGQIPVGVSLSDEGNTCLVKIKGFVNTKYSSNQAPPVGWCKLVADSSAYLRVAGSGEEGRPCIVLSRDDSSKTMRVLLM